MSQVIEADTRQVGTFEKRFDVPRSKVVAVHRSTVQRWEDEILVPGSSRQAAFQISA